ncbi:hypothetical protein PY650_24435 [Rhizobium calliandrae]|uniref:Uncharacterized protein n=1 Tax=Rhizobium calliandrae TaxID=1312182 RepID=A0ABT7KJA9_9HYPH|nr:hypothetical protein [Rhizobium calliandrae]MDL2408732.1 hypothetical protein [Rhizobium calliandrae]
MRFMRCLRASNWISRLRKERRPRFLHLHRDLRLISRSKGQWQPFRRFLLALRSTFPLYQVKPRIFRLVQMLRSHRCQQEPRLISLPAIKAA